jgi:DNA-binding transcriptional MerR regulator
MFRIGEFSRIARVSTRLLRYYDGIGLLSPGRVDPATGYRFYLADQLAQLNRILALKDLGLSLEQVSRMLDEKISVEEIRGMLALKKAELERSLSEEATRLRHIESRLRQIETHGLLADFDVVIKSAEPQAFLSVRQTYSELDGAVMMLGNVVRAVSARVPNGARDSPVVVAHSDFDDEALDLEIGFSLKRDVTKRIVLPGNITMEMTELPAVETLATVVRRGPKYEAHLAFGALGIWMEANGFQIAGPSREIFLQLPTDPSGGEDAVVEVQFPVIKAA